MKYYFDTEFIEDGMTIDLMSIGIVADDGREFYRQNLDCKFVRASDWVWRNVFPSLAHFDMRGQRSCQGMPGIDSLSNARQSKCSADCSWGNRYEIRNQAREFCDPEKHGKPEFWGYYADYDWVVFCQLFGTMMELPKGFPMYCNDLKQLGKSLGDPKWPDDPTADVHNALSDARLIKSRYEWLLKQKP